MVMNNSKELSLYAQNNHDIEIECEFIAMLCGMPEFLPDGAETVAPSDMYFTITAECYSFILSLYQKQGKYVPEEILTWLKDKGSSEETDMIKNSIRNIITMSLEGFLARARIIRKYSILRAAANAVQRIMVSDKETVLDDVEATVQELTSLSMQTEQAELSPVGDGLIEFTNKKYSGKNEDLICTKWEKLDRNLSICRTDLIIIAARPSVGKSAFCLNLAVKFAFQGYKTSLFSLEMSETQILNRLYSCIGQIPHDLLKNNRIKGSEYDTAFGNVSAKLFTKPLYISDKSMITVSEIKRLCRKNKSSIIIIDYLQLITPATTKKSSSRADEISEMTRQLKIMAGELHAVVILLSQLNRSVDGRAIPRPILSDLRESGSIEQDANSVLFLSKENPNDENTDILVDVAKNRDGATGVVMFDFDRNVQTFRELDRRYEPPKLKSKSNNDY
jgi:replicative DNA helicase